MACNLPTTVRYGRCPHGAAWFTGDPAAGFQQLSTLCQQGGERAHLCRPSFATAKLWAALVARYPTAAAAAVQ